MVPPTVVILLLLSLTPSCEGLTLGQENGKTAAKPYFQCQWHQRFTPSKRIALVLRGQSFRAYSGRPNPRGPNKPKYVVPANDVPNMMKVYAKMREHIITPYTEAGFDVDVLTATYETPYDNKLKEAFSGNIILKYIEFNGSTQEINAYANMQLLEEHAEKHGRKYDFVILTRHDTLFKQNMTSLLAGLSPEEYLVVPNHNPYMSKTPCQLIETYHLGEWVSSKKAGFIANDQVQVIPGKFLGCVRDFMLDPPKGKEEPTKFCKKGLPKFWYECTETLAPYVNNQIHTITSNQLHLWYETVRGNMTQDGRAPSPNPNADWDPDAIDPNRWKIENS